jgi:hypothetical protein
MGIANQAFLTCKRRVALKKEVEHISATVLCKELHSFMEHK